VFVIEGDLCIHLPGTEAGRLIAEHEASWARFRAEERARKLAEPPRPPRAPMCFYISR
jgi:hypothetical protein